MSNVEVFDTDAEDMPRAVNTHGELCSIRLHKGNHSTEIRLTVDEAVVLRDKLAQWLFGSGETT